MKTVLIFYDFILILCIPFYLASLILKGKFSWDVFERFKLISKNNLEIIKARQVIWLHAVSLGEVSTCKSLIRQLSLRHPKEIILITTVTSTGRLLAQGMSENNIFSLYMPLDLSFLIRPFIDRIKPKLLILIETELWPNLLYYAQKRKIPVLVLNARLSDRSFGKYRLFSYFFKRLSHGIKMFCVQSVIDKDRFLALGIDSNRIKATGNMKFDAVEELQGEQLSKLNALKERISPNQNDFLIVAASTHRKEEKYILDIFFELKREFSNLRLLIAPRHLERLNSIENIIKEMRMESERISRVAAVANRDSVLLLDTIGQLRLIYSLANLVFMGGSLVPVGGHNILEPAFFKKPIFTGPYMHNFRTITQLFLQNQALIQVNDCNELKSKIRELIFHNDKLKELGSAAKSVLAANQGATLANLAIIDEAYEAK